MVGEESKLPGLVPYHIIFLAPSAGAVVSQLVVGAVLGECHPFLGHFLRLIHVVMIVLHIVALPAEQRIAGNAHDGLDGKVGVVCQMACEVIGAKLVLRVLSVLHEIVGPFCECCPIAVGPFGIAVDVGDGCCQDDDIGALLDGHIAAKASVCAGEADGIDLVVGMWIGAEVVRCEVEAPATALAIVEDGGTHALHQVGIVEEEEGCGRIGEVNGIDTAVGVVLLGEEEQVALVVLENLVRRDAMAVGSTEHFGILGISGGETVVVDDLVLRLAAGHDVIVALLELGKGLLDGLAVACPIAFVVDVHVAHVIDLVVAEHHVAAGLGDGAEIVHVGQLRHLAFF